MKYIFTATHRVNDIEQADIEQNFSELNRRFRKGFGEAFARFIDHVPKQVKEASLWLQKADYYRTANFFTVKIENKIIEVEVDDVFFSDIDTSESIKNGVKKWIPLLKENDSKKKMNKLLSDALKECVTLDGE